MMQKYDSYKDSGIYFLPDIPKSWGVLKAKYLFKEEKRAVRLEDEIVTCFRDGQVTLRKNRRVEGFTNSMKEIGYQGVRKGDLVIHNMDAFAGAIGVSDSDGKATPVYACCTPKRNDINQYYYCYLLRFLARNGFILSLAKGIRERSTDFRFNDFKELYLPVPSITEQNSIVSYLNTATAKIDTAIAQQQKMIDLLNERKQIIINRAVTKGLNPNAKMKDSGVEWIGEVPEHWEVNKFRNLFKTRTGITFTKAQLEEDGEPVISYGQIHSKDNWGASVNPSLIRHIPASLTKGKEGALAYKGDFLFADTSEDFEGCGNCVCIDTSEPIYAGYHTILAKRDNDQHEQYLAYMFASSKWRGQLRSMVNGVKVYSVTQSLLRTAIVLLPPKEEQIAIAEHITKRVMFIDTAIKRHADRIKLLQERKQIIINEVVTGKVKVL